MVPAGSNQSNSSARYSAVSAQKFINPKTPITLRISYKQSTEFGITKILTYTIVNGGTPRLVCETNYCPLSGSIRKMISSQTRVRDNCVDDGLISTGYTVTDDE